MSAPNEEKQVGMGGGGGEEREEGSQKLFFFASFWNNGKWVEGGSELRLVRSKGESEERGIPRNVAKIDGKRRVACTIHVEVVSRGDKAMN